MEEISGDQYRTLSKTSEGFYKEKGSKFIARVFPVSSEEEIKEVLEGLRKEFYDARHHCYAFVLHPDGSRYRANDDGEPNHSAGDPILGQLRSFGLTDTLAVVIRYFGGTKLGVSGLIHAYKTATADALEQAEIVTKTIKDHFVLQFDYPLTSEVMRLCDSYEAQILEQEFTASCKMEVGIRLLKSERFLEEAEALYGLTCEKKD